MKKVAISIPIVLFLVLCICYSNKWTMPATRIEPARIEMTDFDIDTAIEMIAIGDKLCVDISQYEEVSRYEFEEFVENIYATYPNNEDAKWEYMFFFLNEFENAEIKTLRLNKDMFYPTIYHQGIEVVSAKIIKTYYEEQDNFLDNTVLSIREEFLGEDEKLKNWYREYIYEKNNNGSWVFSKFNGQMNFMGDGFTSDYLPLR